MWAFGGLRLQVVSSLALVIINGSPPTGQVCTLKSMTCIPPAESAESYVKSLPPLKCYAAAPRIITKIFVVIGFLQDSQLSHPDTFLN